MRVQFVLGGLVSGGAERQVLHLLDGLGRHGVSTGVLAFTDGRWRSRFEAVTDVKVLSSTGAAASFELARRFRQLRPDLVQCIGQTANYRARPAAIAARAPVVVASERSAPQLKRRRHRAAERLLAPFTHHLVANSSHGARWYLDHGYFSADQLTTIPNGVATPEARRAVEPGAVVGVVGDFRLVKNHDGLVDVMGRLVTTHPEVELRLIGDGPSRAAVEHAFDAAGLRSNVRFAGFVEDVDGALAELAVLVHTSTHEGMPNAVLEAMAVGVPVVVFDAAWATEVVTSGTGAVVPLGDADGMANVVGRLLEDPGAARAMGEAGRDRILSEFGLQRMVDATAELYTQLVEGRTSQAVR